jgi:predicted alpha/beta-hydrolase family hydrolase
MERYPAGPNAPTLVLAHGAGAGETHPWMRQVASGLSGRGISVVTFEFPYMRNKRARPDPAPVLEAACADVWREVVGSEPAGHVAFAGGKSMGGRIASQAAARGGLLPTPAGLVFFGYPLHPPGAPSKRRDRHLPDVSCPMLFLHGTRDPFGDADEMQALVANLADARLHLVAGGDHSLAATKREDPSEQSLEEAIDVAARWMLALVSGPAR